MTAEFQQSPSLDIPPDMPQPTEKALAEAAPAPKEFEFYFYCTEEFHGNGQGTPRYSSQPLHLSRIFGAHTDQGCPFCPVCNREASCIPAGGPTMPPMSVVEYHRLFTQQQRIGGVGR